LFDDKKGICALRATDRRQAHGNYGREAATLHRLLEYGSEEQ
jgi:hypothetical protein